MDTEFDAQFARTVGKSVVGAADVGERFATASRMTVGDYASWRNCWHATAERVEGIADEAAKAGRRRSAGEAYLRVSEYYRASTSSIRHRRVGPLRRVALTPGTTRSSTTGWMEFW